MAAVAATLPASDTLDDERVLANVASIADGPLRAAAQSIDEGHYPLEIMGALGEAGALGAHLERNGSRLGLAIAAMQTASRACGSTGFLMWSHDVCGLYLEASDNPLLSRALLDTHSVGRSFGGTALSNPVKALAGIEEFLLRARRVPGGYVVNGALPWVSHIAAGQYFGGMAGVANADGGLSHAVLFFMRCDEQVALRPCPRFSGMEGTSTWSVRLNEVFVPDADIIADPAQLVMRRIREAFILLQTGMALGIVEGSIGDMRDVEGQLGHVNRFLSDRPDELAGELAELRTTIMRLAETPQDGSIDYMVDVLDARAQASDLALRASQSALLHQGARGYLHAAPPQRRVREAHFAAIVTPAVKHLRWEMARLLRDEVPA